MKCSFHFWQIIKNCAEITSNSSFKSFCGILLLLLATIHWPARVSHTFVVFGDGFPFTMWTWIGSLFSLDKIKNAIAKAFLSVGSFATQDIMTAILSHLNISNGMSVEEIQNQVEIALMSERYYSVAKSFMLYRQKHTEDRETRDKLNFLRRNRIVAGVADATVVVESAHHGGALVTARLAQGYGRDVFAFPGRMGDEYSEGCNNLIRDNKAALVTSADDLVRALGWTDDARMAEARRQGIERTLFPELTEDEQAVADMLGKDNDLQINTLAARTAIPVGSLSAVMFSLEMKGVVKLTAGGVYHLIKN